ncbi:LysR family hydrogen peroxide-inducible transcriptional activator [Haloferula luteola]|uniref:LysR family hydrogen peroxide-inducible transcriptional activator n=1 Tax=Haloferula luteola TaxID=595692 RepID=A0A840VAN0_9BACT|nr:LysR family transcriptional regulator [Haloferula luteola]MBB5351000.1 LysR family hydrogen peroxide-inducible transcriptional activator [Haloferula luteola]
MDLRLLQTFITVVEEGSMSAASRRCHLSQPALSQQMQALEEELGEALLHRRPRGVEPTAAGELLISHARALLAQADRLRGEFQNRRELEAGGIDFGIIPTLAPYLLPQWLGPFRKAHPGIRVSIDEARTRQLLPKVVEGTIEFGILSDVTTEERKLGPLQLRELFREPLLLAAPASHRLALRKEAPTPTDIDPDELIHLSGGHCLAERTLKLCRIRNPNSGLQCDQIATALAMTEAHMGITVVPKLAARDHLRPGVVCRPFAGNGLHRVIHLIKRRDTRLSPAAEKLLSVLISPEVPG